MSDDGGAEEDGAERPRTPSHRALTSLLAMPPPSWNPRTRVVHTGRPDAVAGAPVNPPVHFTSTYHADGEVSYARGGNPTWTAFESALGDLEGGQAIGFASGLAAIAAMVSSVPTGGTVVTPRHAYNSTTALLAEQARTRDLQVRTVDIAETDEVEEAVAGADLLILESPTNPMLEVPDVARLVRTAHAEGALVMSDNTLATPVLARPLEDGVDVVVHSVTKYLAGHSDILMGATVTADTECGRALHTRLLEHRTLHGAIPGPMEAWLALRGMRTLALRVEASCRTAEWLAGRLREHPAVRRVRYPGSGAMLAIEVVGGADGAERVCAATGLWVHSTSLGGVESQIERRRRHAFEVATVPEELIRLSVGIEDADDLWADLDQALDRAAPSAR